MSDSIDPKRLQIVLELTDVEAEHVLFSRLQSLDKTWKLSYGEVGMIAVEVQNRLLWKQRADPETGDPCASFSVWMKVAAPWSYAMMFAAKRDVEELHDIPAEHLAQIPAGNFSVVKQLSSAVRADPGVLHAAKTMRSDALVEKIQRDFPDQHVESRKTLRFRPEASAAEKIEEALAMAEAKGARTRDEQLEMVAAVALEQWNSESEIERLMQEEKV
jgi:hypothetical protein